MADMYKDYTGEQYCMPSWNEKNTMQMNKAYGYNNLADRANRDKMPTDMKAQKVNMQDKGNVNNPGYNPGK